MRYGYDPSANDVAITEPSLIRGTTRRPTTHPRRALRAFGFYGAGLCRRRFLPCLKGAGGAARGGETAAAAAWRRAHGNYGTTLGSEHDTRVRLPSGRRPDAVNWGTPEVRELKPDNPRTVRRGERQVERYRQELEEVTGEPWTSVVDVYRSSR